ncbi:hypothetical protein [Lysinibacillus fusiformis]|uniref:hypothetical protein n=1 Tax=Lysinibacillus fusiformis TaxID=28031 RepID=UPI0020C7550E|nr:hypothetical protein [Lysinibacillus fusiformis]
MKFELEQRAIRGDHEAILSLIEMDEDILYRMAFTYMKNEQDAMDVMQDLVYKALKKCIPFNNKNMPEHGLCASSLIVVKTI